MGKKSPLETKQEELDARLGDLQSKQDNFQGWAQKETGDLRRLVSDSLRAEGQRLEALLRSGAEQSSKAAEAQMQEVQGRLGALESALANKMSGLEARLKEVDSQQRAAAERAESESASTATRLQELGTAAAEASAAGEALGARLGELEAKGSASQEALEQQLRSEVQEATKSIEDRLASIEATKELMLEAAKKAEDAVAAAKAEMYREVGERQEMLKQDLTRQVAERIEGFEQTQDQEFTKMSSALESQKQEVQQIADMAAGAYNRSAEWCIHGFKDKLHRLLQSEDESIGSPGILLCSLPEMVMALHITPGGDKDGVANAAPVPGMASLKLWAPEGLRLNFRLTLGEGSTALSHTFEHAFEGEEGSADERQRVLFHIKNVCQPGLLWNRRMDTFNIRLEVIEFNWDIRKVDPVPDTNLASTGTTLNNIFEGVEGVDPIPRFPGDDDKTIVKSGTDVHDVEYKRQWACEAQLQEHVNREIRGMKSRSIRRVEWRLEGCSRLLDVCRAGESVDSPVFQAAGLDRIQFHFYPLGHDRPEGGFQQLGSQPCAFFISGPSRTTLRGTLYVGSNARPFEHHFDQRGDVGGRDRFGVLQNQINCDDAVTLVMDLTDVEVDLPEISGSLCLREARSPHTSPQFRGSPHTSPQFRRSAGELTAPQPLGTKGSVHMRREDPNKTEEFVKCVSLPTLHTRHMLLPSLKAGRRA